LVFLDRIREFFNLAVLFLELRTIGIKIQFLSINPICVVGDGGDMLGDCGAMSCNGIVSVCNICIFDDDYGG